MEFTRITFLLCIAVSMADAYSDGIMVRSCQRYLFCNIKTWTINQWLWHFAKWVSLFVPSSLWLQWWEWPSSQTVSVAVVCLLVWLVTYNSDDLYPRTIYNDLTE